MSKIKIMCTSTGCIEYAPERYRNLGIDIIRVHVLFNGKEYREGLDLDPVDFYRQLETIEDPKNHLPSTAMPDTEEITGLFEKAIADGYDEMIVFSLSSGLGEPTIRSGCWRKTIRTGSKSIRLTRRLPVSGKDSWRSKRRSLPQRAWVRKTS